MNSNMNRGSRRRDNLPSAVASVPQTGLDILVYRGIDSNGKAVFHLKLARRNRRGDGYYSTYRAENIPDLVVGCAYAASKFAMLEEIDVTLRTQLRDLAERLGEAIAAMALSGTSNGRAQSNAQQTNGLSTAFGPA
jgi:hypothetical protein